LPVTTGSAAPASRYSQPASAHALAVASNFTASRGLRRSAGRQIQHHRRAILAASEIARRVRHQPATREVFRAEAGADDATWARGRGRGPGLGIGAVHFYRATNPVLAAIGLHAIRQAIADYQLTG
jgi:hypothetical protein